jgi:hypothetical protein
MSAKISPDVPAVPEYRGNMQEWARELTIYLEQVLRDHNQDIEQLYEVKQDAS